MGFGLLVLLRCGFCEVVMVVELCLIILGFYDCLIVLVVAVVCIGLCSFPVLLIVGCLFAIDCASFTKWLPLGDWCVL